MEIIVSEGKCALGPCQCKHDLCNLGRMMIGVFIFLKQVLQSSLTLLHDCGNDWNAIDFGPCK